MSEKPVRVVFFQVRKPQEKITRLTETATTHFEKKEPLLLFTDEQTASYVDEILWKFPSTSFLPHRISTEPSTDLLVITSVKKNVNNARLAFNLCPTPLLVDGPFRMIYDFEDLTSPHKQQFSALRFDAYKKAGYLIEARG